MPAARSWQAPHRGGLARLMDLLLVIIALAAAPVATAGTIDRVVAVVEDELVLASEVSVDQALGAHDTSVYPFWIATGPAEQHLIHQAVLRSLAGNLALYQPTDDDVRQRSRLFRDTFAETTSYAAFLDQWGLTESDLEDWLRRRLVIERFLGRNLRAKPSHTDPWLTELDGVLTEALAHTRVRTIGEQQ